MIQRFLPATALSLVAVTFRDHDARTPWLERIRREDAPNCGREHHRVELHQPARHHQAARYRWRQGVDVVLAPVARMQTRGLTEAMLKPGTVVTVLGYQHRKTTTEMRAENITVDKEKRSNCVDARGLGEPHGRHRE